MVPIQLNRKVKRLFIILFFPIISNAQEFPKGLQLDTTYALIQAYDEQGLLKFKRLFDNVDSDKLVFLHYGGSHIQAENPTTVTREFLQNRFGNGGRGLLFNYGAADTYSSVNYASTFTGKWKYNKSYQGRKPGLPLGVCGMVVETSDSISTLTFTMKKPLQRDKYALTVLFENDSISYDFTLWLNGKLIQNKESTSTEGVRFDVQDSISKIEIKVLPKTKAERFRFYGINLINNKQGGVVYHSTGVGASAFRSILILDKLPDQLPLINPDIVLLDFGTNDILYHNKVESSLPLEVEKAIAWWRKLCPDVLLVLTSTQDLYYKNHPITAGITFRNLMDSLARKNKCLFWNWYDLSGGLNTIRDWGTLGYAKKDNIHLTKEGYKVKGTMLYRSLINTLEMITKGQPLHAFTQPLKSYVIPVQEPKSILPPKEKPKNNRYVVKKGETLSLIARKNNTSVTKLKKVNGLKSDIIKQGQVLRLP